MTTTTTIIIIAHALVLLGDGGDGAAGEHAFTFRDVSRESGLLPHASGMRGHAAAWGDADGDGRLDLYIGTFFQDGSQPNLLLRNEAGTFRPDAGEHLRVRGCASGSVFADLDNDGDLDLYISNVAKSGGPPGTSTPNVLFRNDGGGKLTDVSSSAGASPPGLKGRSATVTDFDGDGLLDLVVAEGHSYGSEKRSRLFRNEGGLRFADASETAGLPAPLSALGVAPADVDADGWPDLFFAGRESSNLLLLNDSGKYREAPGSRKLFSHEFETGDDAACGVAFGDLDRDGRLDLLVGQHYKRPWREAVPVRLFLNRGAAKQGGPEFEEVTVEAGLKPLPMKAPHVEIQDFDNDGWPDIFVSIVKFSGGNAYPVIFRNLGVRDGIPRFAEDALAVNDFPTAEDRAEQRTGAFYEKMLGERKIEYYAPAPTADFDEDGRLDLLLVSWWTERGSMLLQNETPGGNWLQVIVEGSGDVNRMGIGSRVNVYRAGKLGEPAALLGCREIAVGYGYASGQPHYAHFGLGDAESVDIEVLLPHGKGRLERKGVTANQRLVVTR